MSFDRKQVSSQTPQTSEEQLLWEAENYVKTKPTHEVEKKTDTIRVLNTSKAQLVNIYLDDCPPDEEAQKGYRCLIDLLVTNYLKKEVQ